MTPQADEENIERNKPAIRDTIYLSFITITNVSIGKTVASALPLVDTSLICSHK
jgi:hypothetical protein